MWSLEVEKGTGGWDDGCVITVIRDVCEVTERGPTGFQVVEWWVDLTRLDEPPYRPSLVCRVSVDHGVDKVNTPDLR